MSYTKQKETIVVVGFGWVGQANAIALSRLGHNVFFYDIGDIKQNYVGYDYKILKRINTPLEKDSNETVYLVCVGDIVDEYGNQDIKNIKKALSSLVNKEGLIILRSTILPNLLKELNFDIYLPEFLHEKVGVEDCENPYYIVIGRKTLNVTEPSFINEWRKKAVKSIECTPEEAAHIKYLSNIWNSIRIAFVNEYGNTVSKPSTKDNVDNIENVTRFIFGDKPYLQYGQSFGGHCLPKDIRSYVKWSKDVDKTTPLINSIIVSNEKHKEYEKIYHNLPQWFSEWQRPVLSGWSAIFELKNSIKRNIKHPFAALKRRRQVLNNTD